MLKHKSLMQEYDFVYFDSSENEVNFMFYCLMYDNVSDLLCRKRL